MNMKITLAVIFLMLSARAIAPDVKTLVIEEPKPVDMYERLMQAILQVESAGDTMAYNATEEAYGPFQIRPIRIADYNKRTGKQYTMKDCHTLRVSREIFLYYARMLGTDYETIAKRWNGSGIMTIDYWTRVKAKLEGQGNKPVVSRPFS
jgi:hypothetical protein